MPKIIAISGKARSGKSTIALFLKKVFEKKGKVVKIVHFGDYLKQILKTYYNWDGKKDETGRHLLQAIGTDLMRKNNANIWVNVVAELVLGWGSSVDIVIIPDTRFVNEILGLRKCVEGGGYPFVVRIERTGDYSDLKPEQKAHPSETELDNWAFDLVVNNNNTLSDFESQAGGVIKEFCHFYNLEEGEYLEVA